MSWVSAVLRAAAAYGWSTPAAAVLSDPTRWSEPPVVLPDCPALRHNTARAAVRGPVYCHCPLALELKETYLARKRVLNKRATERRRAQARVLAAQETDERTGRKKPARVVRPAEGSSLAVRRRSTDVRGTVLAQIAGGPKWMNNVRGNVRVPDFFGAPCTTPAGIEMLDKACDSRTRDAARYRERFQRQCRDHCPVYQSCLQWILNAEKPAGSWGKIYAGLTVNDRRKIAKGWEERERQGAGKESMEPSSGGDPVGSAAPAG